MDFTHYYQPAGTNGRRRGRVVDLRAPLLDALRVSKWKGSRLAELHLSPISIFDFDSGRGLYDAKEDVRVALKKLLATPNALPNLTWLDISAMSDHVFYYPLVDRELLQALPLALPKLNRLCLVNCFLENHLEISPQHLKQFAESFKSTLRSVSFGQVNWMTDDHVAAFLPVVGRDLTRLELIGCSYWCGDDVRNDDAADDEPSTGETVSESLTDATMAVISRECQCLESLSITETQITSTGLAQVLKANEGLRTLDLSRNRNDGLKDAASTVAMYAPQLMALRNYWGRPSGWLDDEGIRTIIDGQMKASKGNGISLQTIGLQSDGGALTNEGLSHALERGVSTIEAADTPPPYRCSQKFRVCDLSSKFPGAQFVAPTYPNYVDGSLY